MLTYLLLITFKIISLHARVLSPFLLLASFDDDVFAASVVVTPNTYVREGQTWSHPIAANLIVDSALSKFYNIKRFERGGISASLQIFQSSFGDKVHFHRLAFLKLRPDMYVLLVD